MWDLMEASLERAEGYTLKSSLKSSPYSQRSTTINDTHQMESIYLASFASNCDRALGPWND